MRIFTAPTIGPALFGAVLSADCGGSQGEAMTNEEARELRAAVSECLDPLYAARVNNVAWHLAGKSVIKRLQILDERLRAVELGLTAREAV